MSWEDQSTAALKRHVDRLEWAADTTDDPLWRKQHLKDRETCLRIIAERGSKPLSNQGSEE